MITTTDQLDVIFADGFEDAFLGLADRAGQTLAVYSATRALTILARSAERDCGEAVHHECDHEAEASDWFGYNVLGSWLGEGMPLWLDDDLADGWTYVPS